MKKILEKMAHEELKALYETDKQHSDTPWEYWEFKSINGDWIGCYDPGFYADIEYRRNPDAPVWPDDKEDARKWRKLKGKLDSYSHPIGYKEIFDAYVEAITPELELIQGYTAEQWQMIIDGKFLCEFADYNFPESPIVSALHSRKDSGFCCEAEDGEEGAVFKNCRPLRIKGVRQPWFGGECPVEGKVVAKCEDGEVILGQPAKHMWKNDGTFKKVIVEFIEL